MKISTVPVCTKKKARQGMTLIEVILGAVILGILAVMASTAFFYPRLLVVNSCLEQSAIHAATAELERHLYAINSTELGEFNTDGWEITGANISLPNFSTNYAFQNPVKGKYLVISTSISFRDGEPPVDLITYRSLEVPSSQR